MVDMKHESSAGVIIYARHGKKRVYLLLKRREGFLDFPKGHVEEGETPMRAALRETFEETGIMVTPIPFFSVNEEYTFDKGNRKIKKSVKLFLAKVRKGTKVSISDEHEGHIWLDAAAALDRSGFSEQQNAIKTADEYAGRYDRMSALNRKYSSLPRASQKWNLSRNFVPGEGQLNAAIMLVGQAPGGNEDKLRRPFIGRSGMLLGELLGLAGLDRDHIYICSCVQFFPPKNRMPTPAEVELCKPFLMEQINIVNPRIVVLVGALAARELSGTTQIMKTHGSLIDGTDKRKYFVTLHPAAAVRLKKNMEPIREDFLKLKTIVKGVMAIENGRG
jgi:DNA polymerase